MPALPCGRSGYYLLSPDLPPSQSGRKIFLQSHCVLRPPNLINWPYILHVHTNVPSLQYGIMGMRLLQPHLLSSNGSYEQDATIVVLLHLLQGVLGHEEAAKSVHCSRRNNYRSLHIGAPTWMGVAGSFIAAGAYRTLLMCSAGYASYLDRLD